MLDELLQASGFPEKIQALEHIREILYENFGNLIDDKDVKQVQAAVGELYQQVGMEGVCIYSCICYAKIFCLCFLSLIF